jgi:hypothetical protein
MIYRLQRLNRCSHQEVASVQQNYLYNHEHDLGGGHSNVEPNNQIITCSLCNISYCRNCGKEVIAIELDQYEGIYKLHTYVTIWGPI